MVKDGRMMVGKPTSAWIVRASSMLCATFEREHSRPIFCMASLNLSRSSALSIASTEAPISSTPNWSSTPWRARSSAQLSAVWPPMVGSTASGRSFSMILATICQVIGSM